MRRARFFGGELVYRSKVDLELERSGQAAQLERAQAERKSLLEYATRKMLWHTVDPRDFVPDYGPGSYDWILLESVGTHTDARHLDDLAFEKCLYGLAEQASEKGCDFVVGVAPLFYNGMTSKAVSGFGVAIGGTGFGFGSPDGVYAACMGLCGVGLLRKTKCPRT